MVRLRIGRAAGAGLPDQPAVPYGVVDRRPGPVALRVLLPMPLLRLALMGTMKGPGVFDTMLVLGQEESVRRMRQMAQRA